MRFSPDFIDKVREATDVVALIGQHVELKRAGSSFRGLCPFPGHLEKTPSFFVSDTKQLYHCFGCKKSGSVFNFLMDFQGQSFPEAVEYLANRAHIPLPPPENSAKVENYKQDLDQKKTYLKLNKFAAVYFYKNLSAQSENSTPKKYLRARGLTDETVQEFKLGLSLDDWSGLTKKLTVAKAPLKLSENLGLIKTRQNGEHFDLFRDRLMFPIISTNGEVLGFGGRSFTDEQQPKYLNSPETPLFHKGRTFYGLHATAKHIRAADQAYVVEGYMDLVTLYQFGIKNVVATLGTAFTSDHAKLLKKMCSHVVCLFDGDQAGKSAAEKSLPLLLDAGVFSRCLTLPDEMDPDDYLRARGVDEFKKLASSAPDHFLSYLNTQLLDFKGQPTEKVEILDRVVPLLDRVRDQRLRTLYLAEVADRLGVQVSWILRLLEPKRVQDTDLTVKNSRFDNSNYETETVPIEESHLVQFMLQEPRYLEMIQASGVVEKFSSRKAQIAAQRVIEKYCQNPSDFDKLGASLATQESGRELFTSHIGFASGGLNENIDKESEMQLIQDCLNRVKDRHLKRQARVLLNALKADTTVSLPDLEAFMKIAKEQKGL